MRIAKRRRLRKPWHALPLVGLALAACGADPPTRDSEIVIFAAASLGDALPAAVADCRIEGLDPVYSFAGSNVLARQIESADLADLFVSADEVWVDRLEAGGRLRPGTRRTLLSNTLVVIVRRDDPAITAAAPPGRASGPPPGSQQSGQPHDHQTGAPGGSHQSGAPSAQQSSAPTSAQPSGPLGAPETLAALLDSDPDRRLVLADPEAVPAGRYARAFLERATIGGESLWSRFEPRVAPALDVRAALHLVEALPAAVGIVYGSDLEASDQVRVLFSVPPELAPGIRYAAAVPAGARRPEAAERLLDCLSGPRGAAVFERYGFVLPPSPDSAPDPSPASSSAPSPHPLPAPAEMARG